MTYSSMDLDVNELAGQDTRPVVHAFPFTDEGVQGAIDAAFRLGNGIVKFAGNGPVYKMKKPAVPRDGIIYDGLPATYGIVGDIPDSALVLNGGTIFECDPGVYAFKHNADGAPSLPANNFGAGALNGCTFRNLYSRGGAGLMAIGSKNMVGAIKCHFGDIGAQDASDWGIRLWNFQQCTFGNRTCRNAVPGGGIQYGFDIPHRPGDAGTAPLLLAGNSTDRDRSFIFNSHFAARGVELYVAPGSQVNQINFMGGGQVNRFGGAATDMTLTFTNNSDEVGFSNPADYDKMVIGGAFAFKTTAVNWWESTRTHFVVWKDDATKKIKLSEYMYGTPRVASETNTKVLTYGGHPGLALAGGASSIATNVDMGWWDIEIQGNVCSIYAAGFRGKVYVSEMYASAGSHKATITARASTLSIETTQAAGLGWVDADTSSNVNIEYNGPKRSVRTTGKTLSNADNGGHILMDAATDQTLTVPLDLDYGFFHDSAQDQENAGKVRYVGAVGVTVSALAATSGPGQRMRLIQTARNTYTVVGDVVA